MARRPYTDVGYLTKDSMLCVLDPVDGKYKMLLPVVSMPETTTAPAEQAKTVLTDDKITNVQGLQSSPQKTYDYNYHRDNIRILKENKGKPLSFLEVNPDRTGEKFNGTIAYGRQGAAVDTVLQGQFFITVSSAEPDPIDDVRDMIKETAIIMTPLAEVILEFPGDPTLMFIELSEGASFTVTSTAVGIATVAKGAGALENQITITPIAAGNCLLEFTITAPGEATSVRTMMVTVL